jgi:hypothetical protein
MRDLETQLLVNRKSRCWTRYYNGNAYSTAIRTDNIDLQIGANEDYIEGSYNDMNYYIDDNREPVEIPEKTSPYAEFDYTTKEWVLNSALAIGDVTQKRRTLLVASDWTDTLSAKTRLGDALYNHWQTYRQALRDISDQAGYPLNVVWPAPP